MHSEPESIHMRELLLF